MKIHEALLLCLFMVVNVATDTAVMAAEFMRLGLAK